MLKIDNGKMNIREDLQRMKTMMGLIIEAYDPEEVRNKYVDEKNTVTTKQFDELKNIFTEYQQFIWILKKLESNCFGYDEVYNFVRYFNIFNKKKKMFPVKDLGQIKTCGQTNEFINKSEELLKSTEEDENLFIKSSDIKELERNYIKYMGVHNGFQVFVVPKLFKNSGIDYQKVYKTYRNILANCEKRDDENKIKLCTVAKEGTFLSYLQSGELIVFHKKGMSESPIQISHGGECKDKNNDSSLFCAKLIPIAKELGLKARNMLINKLKYQEEEEINTRQDDSEEQTDELRIDNPIPNRNKNINEQLNRIQEMMTKILNENFNDYDKLVNTKKILKEDVKKKTKFPTDIIEYVYNTTPISEYGSLEDYIDYVNDYYQDYHITKHSSPSDEILKSGVKTPEQLGNENYNSVDGFFVTKDLNPNKFSSVGKKGKDTNYYIMIPKNLNFLYTDYNFSNIPDFYKGFKMNGLRSIFKYNGDKVRELGYDVIVPEEGKYEWIVVNPNNLIVLGSKKDFKQFLNR